LIAAKTEIQRNNQLPETVNYSLFEMSVKIAYYYHSGLCDFVCL